jgi:hypothetical protein
MVTMTRTYAARRLLEHGPLTFGEILTITRWPHRSARAALVNLQLAGVLATLPAGERNPRAHRYALHNDLAPRST